MWTRDPWFWGLAIGVFLVLRLVDPLGGSSVADSRGERVSYRPFPPKVVATAAPLPEYALTWRDRSEQVLESANGMWRQAFAAAGDTYDAPRFFERGADQPCDSEAQWAGLYCPSERAIVIDLPRQAEIQRNAGSGITDELAGFVVAHEIGHHVQHLRGARSDGTARMELQADCLAAVWQRAIGRARPQPWSIAEDAAHGTKAQQLHWIEMGYQHARPADCDAVWAPDALAYP